MVGGFFVAAADLTAQTLQALLDGFHIGEHQFGLNDFGVCHRVNAAFDVGDVVVFKAADHMGDRVTFADVCEELVAEAFALRCALNEARDINEGHTRRDDVLGTRNRGQFIKARVGNTDVAHVGFNRAERKVRGLCGCCFRQRVEQCRFAYVWQTHDTHFETHDALSYLLGCASMVRNALLQAELYKCCGYGVVCSIAHPDWDCLSSPFDANLR